MATLAERLKQLLIEKDLTQYDLAEMVGTTQGAISNIIKGETQKPRNLLEIANALNVDPNWLRTGDGQPSNDNVNLTDVCLDSNLEVIQDKPDKEHCHKIDYLNVRAAAGAAKFNNEDYPEIISSLWLTDGGVIEIVGKKHTNGIFLINVPTDSMEPTIKKGDIVFIDTNINYYNGDGIYAFSLDGELFIKRFQRMLSGDYLVISDNSIYKTETLTKTVYKNIMIVGKFIRCFKMQITEL
ncbi:XRE family transcriptional regulator [Gallibacterium sp. ZY190522]